MANYLQDINAERNFHFPSYPTPFSWLTLPLEYLLFILILTL
jgi:hypothetical protein